MVRCAVWDISILLKIFRHTTTFVCHLCLSQTIQSPRERAAKRITTSAKCTMIDRHNQRTLKGACHPRYPKDSPMLILVCMETNFSLFLLLSNPRCRIAEIPVTPFFLFPSIFSNGLDLKQPHKNSQWSSSAMIRITWKVTHWKVVGYFGIVIVVSPKLLRVRAVAEATTVSMHNSVTRGMYHPGRI